LKLNSFLFFFHIIGAMMLLLFFNKNQSVTIQTAHRYEEVRFEHIAEQQT